MDESVQKHLTELDDEARLLLKAADLLDSGALVWGNGQGVTSCAYMAMVTAADPQATSHPLSTSAATRFAKAIGYDMVSGIFRWNDYEVGSKDAVVAKLRAVALGL